MTATNMSSNFGGKWDSLPLQAFKCCVFYIATLAYRYGKHSKKKTKEINALNHSPYTRLGRKPTSYNYWFSAVGIRYCIITYV